MNKCLTRSHLRLELASPAYWGLRIIWITPLQCIHVWRASAYGWISHPPPTWVQALFIKLLGNVYMPDPLPYTRVIRIPRLLEVKNYLNNYYTMNKFLTRSRIRVELASPAYCGLWIIEITTLHCIHVWHDSIYGWKSHPPPTGG